MAVVVDIDGAVRTWINSIPGLCGRGNPIANGVHVGGRSPMPGAWIEILGPSSRSISDVADQPRIGFLVKAVGGKVDGGAYALAERAARLLARAIADQHGIGVVTTGLGEQVRLIACTDVQGPVYSGEQDGQQTFTVDCVMTAQTPADTSAADAAAVASGVGTLVAVGSWPDGWVVSSPAVAGVALALS